MLPQQTFRMAISCVRHTSAAPTYKLNGKLHLSLNDSAAARYSAPAGPPAPSSQAPGSGQREGPQQMSTQQIVSDLCSMGFPRDKVERVLASVIQQGKGVDLNSVVDILMNSK